MEAIFSPVNSIFRERWGGGGVYLAKTPLSNKTLSLRLYSMAYKSIDLCVLLRGATFVLRLIWVSLRHCIMHPRCHLRAPSIKTKVLFVAAQIYKRLVSLVIQNKSIPSLVRCSCACEKGPILKILAYSDVNPERKKKRPGSLESKKTLMCIFLAKVRHCLGWGRFVRREGGCYTAALFVFPFKVA